jgi:hypothetical protein
MPRVGFEPMITESERAKTVHTLDRSAIVTGSSNPYNYIITSRQFRKDVSVEQFLNK